jgi:LuxR family transcriptional regulator, maltose regulon positive regulatory protein
MRPPPQAAAAERDVLLATKLHVPQPRPGFLPRPRLLQRLAEGMADELVLLCTPAGFGKTALLGDWARCSPRPVAWLSLDASDNDPTAFWRYVAAALDGQGVGVGEPLAPLLGGPRPAPPEAVVTALVNTLALHSDQVALVLDDYHLIQARPVHDGLAFLLEHLPRQLRLVLASRTDPPLPLARLRARGQLAELRVADLRFTPEETAALLREAAGLELPADSVAALAARTEGWIAGLQLAGLSLRNHPDPAGFITTFSGSHRYVLDYLTEEVLAQQPEHLVAFLLETSMLERLSGPLCDAVTGRADGQALLEALERANLFLVPLDEERRWWRYHHLFADLLRARLQQTDLERVPELHRNAAAWLERHGLLDDAIRHALAAGDTDWAARLVEQHAQAHYEQGEGATVDRWLTALPAGLVRARPRLLVAQAIWALIGGRVDQVAPLLQAAERAFAALPGEPPEPSAGRAAKGLANVPAMVAMLSAELAKQHGDAERTIQFARQGLALADADDRYLRYFVRWNLAVGTLMQGRLEEAEAALTDLAADPWATGRHRYFAVRALYTLGQAQRAQGRLGDALRSCQQALQLAAEPTGRPLPAAGVAHVGLAEILCERDELDAALHHATEGVALSRQLAYAQWLVTGLTALAWIRQAQGDKADALAAIGEAEQVLPSPDAVADIFFPVAVQRIRLLLANGEVAEAARWVRQRGLGAAAEPSYAREREYLVLARVLLAEQAPERALELLGRLHDLAAAQRRLGSVIEIRALQALALADSGDERAALAALAEALRLAAPEGYVRVFVEEGAPMASLLGRLAAPAQRERDVAAGNAPPEYLARLLAAFQPAAARTAQPAGRAGAGPLPGLVEPLSARELEVLQLLATGRSNQQIAEELVVALDTVKKHVSHILDKLGVANRTQAVAHARELQLLR